MRQIATGYPTHAQIYVDGGNPSSATITLYRPAGTKALDAENATVSGNIVSYDYSPADLSGEDYGTRWVEEWAVTVDSTVYTARRQAAMVRTVMECPVTHDALYAVQPALRNAYPDGQSDWTAQIDEGWGQVLTKLFQSGAKPWQALGAEAYRSVALYHILVLCYDILSEGAPDSRWGARLARAEARLAAEWASLKVDEDTDEDNTPDTTGDSVRVFSATAGPTGGPALSVGRDF